MPIGTRSKASCWPGLSDEPATSYATEKVGKCLFVSPLPSTLDKVCCRYFIQKDSNHLSPIPPGFPSLSHFDIKVQKPAKSDFSAEEDSKKGRPFVPKNEYLRLYYCDFLAAPPAIPPAVNQNDEIDVEVLQDWLASTEPRDRTQAYPLLVVARTVLARLVLGEYKLISTRLRAMGEELHAVKVELAQEQQGNGPLREQLQIATRKIGRKRARSKLQKQQLRDLRVRLISQPFNLSTGPLTISRKQYAQSPKP